MRVDPAAVEAYRARRRQWWAAKNPKPTCVDCEAPVEGRADNKRCPACRIVWRRQCNAERTRAYKARRRAIRRREAA